METTALATFDVGSASVSAHLPLDFVVYSLKYWVRVAPLLLHLFSSSNLLLTPVNLITLVTQTTPDAARLTMRLRCQPDCAGCPHLGIPLGGIGVWLPLA